MDSSLSKHTGRRLNILFVSVFALFTLWSNPKIVSGDEFDYPERYLDGLRERGWHDVALEYLEQAKQDPLASDAFIQRVTFEKAKTHVEMAKQSISPRKREQLLDQACQEFISFAVEKPRTPWEVEALSQAGNLLMHRGLVLLDNMEKLPAGAKEQKKALQSRSLELFDQAEDALTDLIASGASQLGSFPKAAVLQKNPELLSQRNQLENSYAEAQFLQGKLVFDKARLYKQGSRESKATLQKGQKAFEDLNEKYEDRLIGFLGQLYRGRCFQEMEEWEDALQCFDDLVDRPISNPDFRKIVARAFRRRAEVHAKMDNHELAIQESRDFLNDSRNDELSQPEWLAVMFRLANSYESHSATPEGSADAKRLLSESRKLLREVSRNPGEFQAEARAALASSSGVNQLVEVKTFDEAYAAGSEALNQAHYSELTKRLAKKNNPSAVHHLQQQEQQHREQARLYFETCLRLANEESPQEKLLAARYYVCWLYWNTGRVHESAVMGSFLARRYPENQYAPQAAKIALAAYEKMFNDALKSHSSNVDFESQQLHDIAKLMIAKWPDSEEAAAATNLLLNAALKADRIADAEALLDKLPPGNRARGELSLGSSLWARYLRMQESSNATPSPAALQQKQRATDLMSRGFEALREQGNPSAAEAVGVLYLAQAHLEERDFSRAIEILEDREVGPLTLVRRDDSSAKRREFVLEVYKAALRAFGSVSPPQREKTQAVMRALEETFGNDEKSQRQLTSIYLKLGVELQGQIAALSASGRTAQANALAGAFEDLIKRVTSRSGGGDNWSTQNWIAQTNLQVGQGLTGKAKQQHLTQAQTIYRSLLSQAERNPNFAPSEVAVLAVRKHLADVLLAQERYQEAFDEYTQILKNKPKMLELQQAAAAALQNWGKTNKDPQKLEEAIQGALLQANRKKLVWGWLRLASLADNAKRKSVQTKGKDSPQARRFHDIFFSARLQVAQARFEAAKLTSGAERQHQLKKAKQSIKSMQRLYPELGGPRWKDAYLKLLKDIEGHP